MKSPDEIKKGLDFCSRATCGEKDVECPYECGRSTCITYLTRDSLALIQQLQAENAEQAARIQQLEAERDALMHYLRRMGCDTCLYDDYDGSEPPCINCTATRDLWQFQGVQKEDSNA